MNQVQYFNFNQNAIQVINKNGEAWFIASEVAAMLGYRDSYNMTRILDNDEKGTHNVSTLGGNQDVSVINESGFYHAAFKSRKPEVKPFRKWVTSEVLPTIRKTGGYQVGQKTTADDRTGLRQAVAALVGRRGIDYSSAYSMIHQRFNVEAIEDIPAEKLPEAVAYAHALTLHTGLTGEVLDREPLPAPQPALPISGNALYDLAVAVSYGAWAIQMGRDVSLPLKQLGCKQAVTMWTVWAETRSRLKAAANALEILSAHADAEHAAKIRPMLPEIRNLSAV
ncbi:BRO-N domain-containing protein [Neisseria meningitidis]|uniref:BRO-N domain-containing protein n=1 Tax=Neisseria meningitidis TaxID=487 RepID=UPI000766956E|nr:BRO family protein [Neisseria meningitidis]CWP54656.1 putative phage associated protein [Neisseria meningitidis]CWT21796.1 putative phage associated protein [Neisseria meningitidis]